MIIPNQPQILRLEITDNKYIYILDRVSKEVIKIPDLPSGYKDKNKNIKIFIKGLFRIKYFIG